ncbi:MAG: DUF2147 domain-containing protein [Caulobacter sp.]|nr:DUF2147 domain-containing protein [Caulobacter sp.]
MISALAFLAGLAGADPATATAADLAGLWHTPVDGGSVVRLVPCGQALCGRIVSSPQLKAVPDQKDVRNRDEAQRGRALANLMFMQVKPIGPGRWGDGWVYNPEDGGTYKGVMELKPDGTLRLTGCIVRPFCKTQTWRRA